MESIQIQLRSAFVKKHGATPTIKAIREIEGQYLAEIQFRSRCVPNIAVRLGEVGEDIDYDEVVNRVVMHVWVLVA